MSFIPRYGLPLAFIALAGLASSASAQIVKDGGFEKADSGPANSTAFFTPGTPFDLRWAITGEVGIDNKDAYVYGGSKSLFLNSGIGTDSISQNLKTNPNDFYTLSFYANDDTPGDLLNVSFGETTFDPIAVTANGYAGPPDAANKDLFTLYTFSGLTTSSPFTALSFSSDGTLTSGQLELDGIKITSSPVPESSTSLSLGLLLMLGVGGAAWTAKKTGVKNASIIS